MSIASANKLGCSGRVKRISDFANRVDQTIIHDKRAAAELKPRKPDQVYGIQQTREFLKYAQSLRPSSSKAMAHEITYYSTLEKEMSPFHQRDIGDTLQLIFPFLIGEAKTERGSDFRSCLEQTAFPIWRLLKLQEGLVQRSGNKLVELGGPLVWFFANRGALWRLYGCYTDEGSAGNTLYACAYPILGDVHG
jgi:hypothetical protein